jgi:hypothetical protein
MAQKATKNKEGIVINIVDLCEKDGTATIFTSLLDRALIRRWKNNTAYRY